MRLAIFVDQVFWRDGDVISTDEPYALFLASFAEVAEEVIFIGRQAPATGRAHYVLGQAGISLCPLPFYPSLYELWKADPQIYRRIGAEVRRRATHHWDALLLCGPHPIGQMIARQCLRLGIPLALVVRQDLVRQMEAHRGLKRLAAVAAARILEWDFRRLAQGRTVFAVGAELARAYAGCALHVLVHAPCLVDNGLFERLATVASGNDPAHLLCVGRLAPEKGHDDLLQAMACLLQDGFSYHLGIVGTGPLEQELKARVATLGLSARVTFHGYVPYGPALFHLYGEAGMMVLPSWTEGLPQVISEALSAGLPTVATRVGGIPAFLTDGVTALLVPPREPQALAAAIARLVRDGPLRERLRRNGRALMRENTLEANRARILGAIRDDVV